MSWEQWQVPLLIMAVTMPRMIFAFLVVPFLSPAIFPAPARNAMAFSLATLLYPVVQAQMPGQFFGHLEILLIVLKEAFIGLILGYMLSLFFWAAQSIGFFIDTQRGATMAGSLLPQFGGQVSPLGGFFSQALVVIFFLSGGMGMFLSTIYQSYQFWPVFSFYPRLDSRAVPFFLAQLDFLMSLIVFLSAPIVLAMFLLDLVMGVISRFVPSLNVFFLAMPVKSGLAVFMLIFYISLMMDYFRDRALDFGAFFDTVKPWLE